MSDVVALARPDTSDMVRVHRVFREGFAVAPQLLGAARAEDSAQIQRIATYYDALVLFLHVHHEGEDELLWPRLLDRCPARAATVEHAAGQHQGVLGDLAVSEARLAEWKAEPTPDRAASLAAEERTILPLAAEHLTVEEWAELPTHGMQTGGQRAPHLMWLVLGLIREQMSAEQRAHMDSVMPPPVLELWTTQGEPMFREFITELRH
jgi:hypothetical protein